MSEIQSVSESELQSIEGGALQLAAGGAIGAGITVFMSFAATVTLGMAIYAAVK